ncbi:MAG: hypothetical protein ACTSXO_10965 [Candidatus Heimdallarchaeota archaeon]
MKKKIICVVLCVVLLLIFTSASFGAYDPDWYRFREHPWSDMLLSPGNDTPAVNVLMLSIGPNITLTFILNRTISSSNENLDQPNIDREKWTDNPSKNFLERSPQR